MVLDKEKIIAKISEWMMKNVSPRQKVNLNIQTTIEGQTVIIDYIVYDPQCYDDRYHLMVSHTTPHCIDTWSSVRNVSSIGLQKILYQLTRYTKQ